MERKEYEQLKSLVSTLVELNDNINKRFDWLEDEVKFLSKEIERLEDKIDGEVK